MNIEIDPPSYWEATSANPIAFILSVLFFLLTLVIILLFIFKVPKKVNLRGENVALLTYSIPLIFSMGLAAAFVSTSVQDKAVANWRVDTLSASIENTYGIKTSREQVLSLGEKLISAGWDNPYTKSNRLEHFQDVESNRDSKEIYGEDKFFVDDKMVEVTLIREGETLKLVYSDGVGSGVPLVELPKA